MPRENVLHGFHSAEEIIRNQPGRVNHIWTVPGHRTGRLKRLLDRAHESKIPIQIVAKEALARLTGTHHHQDIAVEVSPYRYYEAQELLENVGKDSVFCILDEIQDATNLGNLIRTMEAAGVDGIFLPQRRSAFVTAATHRLSAGALEHVKIARVKNLANLIVEMQEKGIRIICADTNAPKLWYEADYSGPIAILVGNEQRGVRRLLKQRSSDTVRIPMLGKIQSLNVSAAAAVLLYETFRQKKQTTRKT